MPTLPYLGTHPTIGPGASIAADAYVLGRVTIGSDATLSHRAVIRADQDGITIGDRFWLGINATVHVDFNGPVVVGHDVVVEDRAVVHACTLGDAVLVEREATILSGASVGGGSIVMADALVSENKSFPARSVIAGTPGRVIRETTDDEVEAIRTRARTLARRP
jgi:carbonic anhydrase/acetyltransferase-like protein (isoleucine patch superfamily)